MATKKKAGSTRKKRGSTKSTNLVPGDPPIIVGGGGSAYIWVKLGHGQTPVNPSSDNPGIGIKPGAPRPTGRDLYSCSRITGGPASVFFYSGAGVELPLTIDNDQTWYIRVE